MTFHSSFNLLYMSVPSLDGCPSVRLSLSLLDGLQPSNDGDGELIERQNLSVIVRVSQGKNCEIIN